MDTEGAIGSVCAINRVSILSGLDLEKNRKGFPRDNANCL